jgi:hypothetical protein
VVRGGTRWYEASRFQVLDGTLWYKMGQDGMSINGLENRCTLSSELRSPGVTAREARGVVVCRACPTAWG